jgi:hypothetical protein
MVWFELALNILSAGLLQTLAHSGFQKESRRFLERLNNSIS